MTATLGADGAAPLRRRSGRWRLQDWRLRTKLTAVLLVPLLLAGVLGGLRVSDLMRQANDLASVVRQVGFVQQVGLAVHDLQGERHLATVALATDRPADQAALQAQYQRVDAAVTILGTGDFGSDALAPTAAYRAALGRLSGLAAVRRTSDERNVAIAYSSLIAPLLDLHRRVLDGIRDPLARQAGGLKALAVAKEQASQQHALLHAATLSGVLPAEQQATLRTAEARFDAAVDEFRLAVPGSQLFEARAVIDRKRLLEAALDRAVRQASLQTVPADWNSAAAGSVEAIRQGEITQLNALRTATAARSNEASRQALWNGAVVAVLLILALATLLVVVRSLLRPLRAAAFDVADRQLPEAIEQISRDGMSSQTTVDPVPVHSKEEVAQAARAVDTVHAQAVRLAAEQAAARSSLNDTFLDLSGRNQGLVDRQRQLLDELRRRQHDPELVSGLLQLDHLAARMRRHSDNLLVLAGGRLPRRTQGRMAVVDVLRSAVSEIEQYQRVTVRQPPAAMVASSVAGDLVHLLAELLDNAVNAEANSGTYEQTTVTLSSTLTEDQGLLIEIVDSGPGLPPDQLQAINGRLASPPAVDASVSRQMGLSVVSRLAAQHGITVRLRQRLSQIGITTAVSLPSSVVSIDPRPSNGSHSSNDRVSEAPVTAEWSGTAAPLPLQVSVIDEATAAELFSPTSIGIATSPPSGPRTAEQEWRELFGDDQTQPRPESQREPLAGQLDVDMQGGVSLDPLASPLPLSSAAATGQPQEVREEIFELVSAWFRERQSASASNGDTTAMAAPTNGVSSTNAHDWRSPLDEEWHAAQALAIPVDHGVTTAGLPKRQPLAHLVSGAEGIGRSVAASPAAGPVRVPDDVRGRLSRYQQGLRVGRHARIGPDEQPTITDTMHGRIEEDQ